METIVRFEVCLRTRRTDATTGYWDWIHHVAEWGNLCQFPFLGGTGVTFVRFDSCDFQQHDTVGEEGERLIPFNVDPAARETGTVHHAV